MIGGVAFSVRGIDAALTISQSTQHLHYFANSPLVLFAFVMLFGGAAVLYQGRYRIGMIIGLLMLSLLPLIAMTLTLQRASLTYAALCVVIITAISIYQSPMRGLILTVILGAATFMLLPDVQVMADSLLYKTRVYGGNMRIAEAAAVWDTITVSPQSLLLGQGWGGAFASPAVADITVTYTHSFVTFVMLKTGLIGLIAVGIYLGVLMKPFLSLPLNTRVIVMILALGGAFIIPLLFYASYKSFGFGLILTLMAVSKNASRIEPSQPSD